jgi:hypothetical protein
MDHIILSIRNFDFTRMKYGFWRRFGHEKAFFGKNRILTSLNFGAKFDIILKLLKKLCAGP